MFFLFALALSIEEPKEIDGWKEDLHMYREEKKKLVKEIVSVNQKIKNARNSNEDYSELSKQLDELRKRMIDLDHQFSDKNHRGLKRGQHAEIPHINKNPSIYDAEDIKKNDQDTEKLEDGDDLTLEKIKEIREKFRRLKELKEKKAVNKQ